MRESERSQPAPDPPRTIEEITARLEAMQRELAARAPVVDPATEAAEDRPAA